MARTRLPSVALPQPSTRDRSLPVPSGANATSATSARPSSWSVVKTHPIVPSPPQISTRKGRPSVFQSLSLRPRQADVGQGLRQARWVPLPSRCLGPTFLLPTLAWALP